MSGPLGGRGAASWLVVAAVLLVGCSPAAAVPVAQVTTVVITTPTPISAPTYPLGVTDYPPGTRRTMPPLTGATLSGEQMSTTSLRGHVTVLTVWASWCDPCRAELPALAALARRPDLAPVQFVGLDEHDRSESARSMVLNSGSNYPQLVDDGALLARLSPWLPDAVPGVVVIDAQGRVAARVVGPVTADQLRGVLDQMRT